MPQLEAYYIDLSQSTALTGHRIESIGVVLFNPGINIYDTSARKKPEILKNEPIQ